MFKCEVSNKTQFNLLLIQPYNLIISH